jgi:hypothetical protein
LQVPVVDFGPFKRRRRPNALIEFLFQRFTASNRCRGRGIPDFDHLGRRCQRPYGGAAFGRTSLWRAFPVVGRRPHGDGGAGRYGSLAHASGGPGARAATSLRSSLVPWRQAGSNRAQPSCAVAGRGDRNGRNPVPVAAAVVVSRRRRFACSHVAAGALDHVLASGKRTLQRPLRSVHGRLSPAAGGSDISAQLTDTRRDQTRHVDYGRSGGDRDRRERRRRRDWPRWE